jgi:hypothetical protein
MIRSPHVHWLMVSTCILSILRDSRSIFGSHLFKRLSECRSEQSMQRYQVLTAKVVAPEFGLPKSQPNVRSSIDAGA